MLSLEPGDIVLASFPFEEDANRNITKKRPCLVLAVKPVDSSFYAAKITTTPLHHSWAYHLNSGSSDVSSGRIKKESWINLNRREWLSTKDCILVFAKLKADIMKDIISRFNK